MNRKPMIKLTAMAPRTMQPRSTMASGKVIKAKPTRSAGTSTPLSAFKPASNAAVGDGPASGGDVGSGTGQEAASNEAAAAAAAPVAPRSNAEFRALMLSGALKKSRQ